MIAEVYTNRFHKFFYSNDLLSNVVERDDIYAYETEKFSPDDQVISVRVYNRVSKYKIFVPFHS